MAGIVNEQSQLIVTGGGGGGSNVTVVGPLGSRPAAQSISIALASDQIPLQVTGATGGGPIEDGANPAIKATVFNRTNSHPLATELVDAAGDPVFVNSSKELSTTLLHHDSLVQKGDGLQFDNILYPSPGEGGPLVGAVPLLNNGSAYDRAPGDATNGAVINVKAFGSNPVVTGTGPSGIGIPRVTESFDSPVGLSASGTIQLNGSNITVSCLGASVVVAQIISNGVLGSPFPVIQVQGSNDGGTTWGNLTFYFLNAQNIILDGFLSNPVNYNNGSLFFIPCGGFTNVRLIVAPLDLDGPMTWNLTTSGSTQWFSTVNFVPGSIVSIGGASGGSPIADVVSNNTSATPANKALVVALSPNTPLPAGTNSIGSITTPAGSLTDVISLLNLTIGQLIPILEDIRTDIRVLTEINRAGLNVDDEPEKMRRELFLTRN